MNVISWSYCSREEKLRVKGTVTNKNTRRPHFFDGQLFEPGQGAGEEADYKGCGGADDIQHGGREHRDVCVLPGEGVEKSHDRMTTLRQSAAQREKES